MVSSPCRGAGSSVISVDAVLRHANAIADAQASYVVLHVGEQSSIARADGDPIRFATSRVALLSLVSSIGACRCAGYRGQRLAGPLADLMAQNAADDGAAHRTGAGSLRGSGRDELDVLDRPLRVIVLSVLRLGRAGWLGDAAGQ